MFTGKKHSRQICVENQAPGLVRKFVNVTTNVNGGVRKQAVRRPQLVRSRLERLFDLLFYTHVAPQANRFPSAVSKSILGCLLRRPRVFIQHGDFVAPSSAKLNHGPADSSTSTSDNNRPQFRRNRCHNPLRSGSLASTMVERFKMKIPAVSCLMTTLMLLCFTIRSTAAQPDNTTSGSLIPRRSSQIKDGFGINADLPREPYIPSNRWWWTRLFDAGINFIRIGQYENSSDYTSWDWVERRKGEYSLAPEVDDYIDSVVENGVHIEIQLLYGNPLYTSPAGRLPEIITPAPGSFHNPDRSLYSVFWPPKTTAQIAAFTRYAQWMVNHFRGRVEYYEIWNEPNIDYWNPHPSPEEYGTLFKAAAAVVHETDPKAKVVFGGLAGADREFAKRALDACDCAATIDVFAYHTYPNYGHNLNPEAVDDQNHTDKSPKRLRDLVRAYPGIRPGIAFFNDEFNDGIPSWAGSDESVQAKYIPRGLIADRAAGVRTFPWLIVGATDGNESDDFGMLHGLMFKPNDFTPRPVFAALQNTNTLFSDTRFDSSLKVQVYGNFSVPTIASYGFRSPANQAIVAYWLPVLSRAGNQFPIRRCTLRITNSGIEAPVLIDIVSGKMTALSWKSGGADTLEVPLKDSPLVVADKTFLSWRELPEAPSDLTLSMENAGMRVTWKLHGGHPEFIFIERRRGLQARWESLSKLSVGTGTYLDAPIPQGQAVSYRVRAANAAGNSAYSNIATAH
jgi:Glycosyl hydrolases family 39